MTTTIKAGEVKPGMVIGWTDSDVYTRMSVARYDSSHHSVWSMSGIVRNLKPTTEVEVISSPPVVPEPETLGARVKAGDNLFLRVSTNRCSWLEVTGGVHDLEYTWEEVNEFGMVTIIEGDPSWDTRTAAATDSDQWDNVEEALKHCDRVIDMEGDPWFYLGGDLHVTLSGTAIRWSHSTEAANNYGPFRRA